jgi:cysteine dioxygenase
LRKTIRLSQLVDDLRGLDPASFTVDNVVEVISRNDLAEASILRFCEYLDHKYARHSIFRNELFDMMVICWKPGQVTPVHSHNGQCGWVRVLRGRIQETRFQYRGCNSPDNFIGGKIDCIAGGGAITLDRIGATEFEVGETENAMTLHVYSLPHDSCVAYDLESRTCRRRDLSFDTTVADRGLTLQEI